MRIRQLQRTWDRLGREDPMWAILAVPGKRGRRWNAEEFFDNGAREIADLMQWVGSLGLPRKRRRALDFGCGIGRLTQPLAEYFDEVCGVDIAPSMISRANELNRHGARCTYLLNEKPDLACLGDATFDLVYSNLTLQHMPPEIGLRFVSEFFRVLDPGGVVVFQMAAEPLHRRSPAASRLRRFARWFVPEAAIALYRRWRYGHLIDMYGVPKEQMIAAIERSGGQLLDVVSDTWAGGGWTSFRYCARRESGSADAPG